MRVQRHDQAVLKIFAGRRIMGKTAAAEAARCLRELLQARDEVNCVFAAAPSQDEFLEELIRQPDVEWERVNAFHMDEYLGLPVGHGRSFSGYLIHAIFGRLPFRTINFLNGMAEESEECARYASLLERHPTDVVCMGIGENGHIAFNDPPVANFRDPELVKTVLLDPACRAQQVHDRRFARLDEVPVAAITLTIPALMRAPHLFCVVPGERKAQALYKALRGPIGESCPASIIRTRRGVRIYADKASAMELSRSKIG